MKKKLFLCGLAALTLTVKGDERLFTYSYTADSILPKGGIEAEQWITYRGGREDQIYSRFDLREEIEFGITDRYTTALYLNFRNTHSDFKDPALPDENEFEFKGISSEHKYQVLNPNLDPVGLLLYGEITTDGEELELEEKLVLSKTFGEKWTVALNAILEQEWEFEADETEKHLALVFTTGLSYQITPHWAIGLEAMNEREFDDLNFDHQEHSGWYVGPNVHYGAAKWWATLTVMPQVAGSPNTQGNLNLDDFEKVQVRLIGGINF